MTSVVISTLNELAAQVHETAVQKGWYDEGTRPFPEVVALFHSEISEALEDFRNGRAVDEIYFEGEKPCGVPIELADVIIRILDTCAYEGVDIGAAVAEKMAYNATRPYRHGGKAC